MNGHRLAMVWALAAALALVPALILAGVLGSRASALADQLAGLADSGPLSIFIGSSLTEAAIPPLSGTESPLGFPHQRFSIRAVDEYRLLAMAEAAAAHADTVFIETAPLLLEFGPPRAWPAAAILDFSDRVRREVDSARRTSRRNLQHDGQYLAQQYDSAADPVAERTDEPRLRTPAERDRWRALAARMTKNGGRLILLDFPRSATAASRLDETMRDTAPLFVQELARELGAALFQPAPFWSDDHFADRAHMNARGRECYLRELRDWLAAGH
jgi:hypothetical protein